MIWSESWWLWPDQPWPNLSWMISPQHTAKSSGSLSPTGNEQAVRDCCFGTSPCLPVPLSFIIRCQRVRGLHKRRLWAGLREPSRWVQLHLQGRLWSTNWRPHQVPAWDKHQTPNPSTMMNIADNSISKSSCFILVVKHAKLCLLNSLPLQLCATLLVTTTECVWPQTAVTVLQATPDWAAQVHTCTVVCGQHTCKG